MIYSLVSRRIEDGGWTGVSRFDASLRTIWPDLRSITPNGAPVDPSAFARGDVVIADNHLSLLVPDEVPTVVVHHGCALTHYERVASWRTTASAAMVRKQEAMFARPNRVYIAPSEWVRGEFCRHYGLPPDYATILPHWVPEISSADRPTKPTALGDWRDPNKGSELWQRVAIAIPEMRFQPLVCDSDASRIAAYQGATHYLCLSASEGGAYAVSDAEAAGLVLISTDVGNAREYGAHVIRRDVPSAVEAIRQTRRRHHASFFSTYTRERWISAWQTVVDAAREGAPPLCESW